MPGPPLFSLPALELDAGSGSLSLGSLLVTRRCPTPAPGLPHHLLQEASLCHLLWGLPPWILSLEEGVIRPQGRRLEGLKCTTRQGVKHFLCPHLAVFRSTRPCRTACPWHGSRDRREVEGTERDRRELEEVGGGQEKRKVADLAGGLPSKPVLGSWGFCHKPPPTRHRSCRAPSGAVQQGPSPCPPSFCTALLCWHLLAYRNSPQFCLGPHTVFSLCARVRMSPFHKDTCPVGSGPTLMAPFPPDPLCKDTPPP